LIYHMKKFKISYLWGIILLSLMSKVNAVTIWTLRWEVWGNGGFSIGWTDIEGSRSVLELITLINSYLRFSVWFVCFLFMIINGYKLITAHGDEKKTQSALRSLWWALLWIVICLLAYIIVNLAVKIFA
jgi:hypothetical protein